MDITFILLAYTLLAHFLHLSWEKRISVMRERELAKSSAIDRYANKKYLAFKGSLKMFGNTKIATLTCSINKKSSFFSDVFYINYFFFYWSKTKESSKQIVAGIYYEDYQSLGRNNIKWEHRKLLQESGMPTNLISGLENFCVQEKVEGVKNKDYFKIHIPLNKCDPITGVFTCEALINGRPLHRIHASVREDFSFDGKDNEPDSVSCLKYGKSSKERNECDLYKKKEDTLGAVYSKEEETRHRRPESNFLDFKVKYHSGKRRRIELICKVQGKYVRAVKKVDRFYIFYQPNELFPRARILLVGLVRGRAKWADGYSLRTYPHLKKLLKIKDESWRGFPGTGNTAEFRLSIPFKECDTFTGNFHCEAMGHVTGEHAMPTKKTQRDEIMTGMCSLKGIPITKIDKNCEKRLKNAEKKVEKDQLNEMSNIKGTHGKQKHHKVAKKQHGHHKNNVNTANVESKNNQKEESSAMVYVGAGVGVLILLVIGFLVFNKMKSQDKKEESKDGQRGRNGSGHGGSQSGRGRGR